MKPKIKNEKLRRRLRRAQRMRITKVQGTPERPRLAVFRSAKHIYAQLIDDLNHRTLFTVSTQSKDLRDSLKDLKKQDASEKVGQRVAQVAKDKGVTKIVFDRSGFPYHGRVAALAKGAREGGLEF